ncbi:MAG: restriction endonuclease subunit S [Proteobacteria bacterium]|nr:restriction endonuclease subunit S [Pseudomonadota bacterium]
MAGEWTTLPLEDCMAAIIDYRGKSPEKTTFGVPLVTAKIVKGGRIEKPEEFIAEADFDDWMRRGMPKPGDIVMTTEAPLGEVAQLDGRKVALAQRVITLRGKPDVLDNTFLKFLLQSNPVQEELRSRGTGTTVVGIRQSELRKVSLTLPPLAEQKAIAAVLGALDDKIELNQRMNATLETMARALFQSWFVDFDPVRAKLDGRKPGGLDETTAALFPATFQDSEAGHIPKSWTVGKVGDLATLNRGAVNPGDFPTEAFDHFSLPAFDNGRTPKPELGSAIMSNKFTVTPNSVLLSKLNPHIPRIWLPDLHASRRSVCSTEFMVACSKPGVSREYLFSLFTSSAFASIYGTLVTGTTGSHQRIRPESVLDMKIVIPSPSLIRAFTDIVKPMFDRINRNTEQSRTLATLRDTLLPKLLSGELKTKNIADFSAKSKKETHG